MTAAPKPTAVDEAPGAEAAAVIVVGSLHYDIMVDAPGRPRKGETLAGRSWVPKFGGKGGNQAVAARRQRVSTAMVGAVGKDSFGEALLAKSRSGESRSPRGCGFRSPRVWNECRDLR